MLNNFHFRKDTRSEDADRLGRTGMISIFLMTMCTSLDMGIMFIALPAISEDLNVSMSLLSWIMMGFLISLTTCALISGIIIDIFGIRRVLIAGFLIFLSGLLVSATSPSIVILIAGRCIQGIGGSVLLVGGPSLLKNALPEDRQAEGFGYLSIASAAGFLMGPALGGILMFFDNWRIIFWALIIPVIVGLFLVLISVPSVRTSSETRINPVLMALLFGSVISFILALNQGRELGWTSIPIISLFILSIILGYLFFSVNQRANPMFLDVSLFRSKNFKFGNIVAFLMKLSEGGPLFLLPFYLVIIQNLDLQMASIIILVVPIVVIVFGYLYGKYSHLYSSSTYIISGMAFLILSFLGYYMATTPIMVILLIGIMVLRGSGIGLFYPPNRSDVICAVPRGKEGVGSGYLRMIEQLGYIISIALFETIFSEIIPMRDVSLASISHSSSVGVITSAFQAVFILAACIAALILVITLLTKQEHPMPK